MIFTIFQARFTKDCRMKKILYTLILISIVPFCVFSQYYETGQDPASIRWRQINTNNFQVIYPDDFEQQAQRVAYIFEKVYAYAAENLKQTPRKISVVLHTYTVKSNALVAWAPKRIEFYTTPHQQMYAQDWLEQLAIHEFTHVMQMNRVQEELPAIFKLLLGEQAAAAVVGAYLPFWLIEGDAVTNETAFSASGRGRLPSFLMENKAALLEKGDYSLSKSYLGSYKDYVPNHYYVGYWLTAKAKEKYGADVFNQGITKAARNPFSINPINSVLKKETGSNQNSLYKQVFSELKNEWQQEINEAQAVDYPVVSPDKKAYTRYLMPHVYNGNIYALRESIDDITRIVCIDKLKNEKIVHSPGYLFEESFSGEKNLLIWSENQPDIRWTHSDRSVICVFNIESGELKRFKTENKVFAPQISPDLQSFAAVEVDVQNNCFLSVFDLKTGKRTVKYTTADNQYFFTPCWNEKSDQLYFIALNAKGKYLASLKIGQESHVAITEPSFSNIKNQFYSEGKIYFVGSYSGIDNIYAIDLSDKSLYKLTSVKFGADYPSVNRNDKELIFSNYSSDGFALSAIENQPDKWTKLDVLPDKKFELAENLTAQMKGELILEKPDSVLFPSKKYSKLGHAFNFHSWAPLYVDADEYDIRPGITMFSQNKLGTSVINLGYDYSTSDKTGKFVAGFKYSGWFPVFEINANTGKSASQYYQITQTKNQEGQIVKQDTVIKRFTWSEQNLNLNVNLPFIFSSGSYHRLLQPELRYEYTNITHDSSSPDAFFEGNYQTLSYRLYFHNLQHMSQQSIQSKWGQTFEFIYRHSPSGKIDFGTLVAGQSYLYFPGLMKNQGLRVYNAYQEKTITNRNSFSNSIRIPRGYHSIQNTSFYSFAGDYRLPIVCPDLSIGKLAYIKRIRASLFYDYGKYKSPVFSEDGDYVLSVDRNISSLGIELISDLHALRFFAPLQVGLRSIYRPTFQDMQFEFLFSIDFSGL